MSTNKAKTSTTSSKSQGIKKRSKLSTAAFIRWIRTRYHNRDRRNLEYLYFPHELVRQTSIQKIFTEFDSDGSGGLSRTEVFDMFNSFGIGITMQNLDELYDSVQVNLEELDCDMFKKCALSEKSNKVFRSIIKEMDKDVTSDYMPHNFTNMIIYLVFLSKRDELRNNLDLNKGNIGIDEKVKHMESLIELKDLSLNNERLNNHMDTFKQSLKSRFRDIWENVNQRYGQKFPYTPKTEEEFYQFYKSKINQVHGGVSLKTLNDW